MDLAELRALAAALEPLSIAPGDLLGREWVAPSNGLVSGFGERVTRALNRLTMGEPLEPGLEQELRLLAKECPP